MLKNVKALAEACDDHRWFTRVTIAVIGFNFVILVLETYPAVMQEHSSWLKLADRLCLTYFVVELLIKIVARLQKFFWPLRFWNWFDFVIVAISLIPFLNGLSGLRALRILRIFSVIRRLEVAVEVLLRGIFNWNVATVAIVMMTVVSVAALVISLQFGALLPERFGNWHVSLRTHFQLIAFDGWGEISEEMGSAIGAWTLGYLMAYSFLMTAIISALIGFIYEEIIEQKKRRVAGEV
jgi:voltage-gated sodium channel